MNEHLIVTTLDAPYWPGLVALHNSFKRHSADGFDFAALVFGDDTLVKCVEERGIRVIANPLFPVLTLPTGKHHTDPEHLPAMYGRLLIPNLFPEYKRIVYIDADSVILKSLRPLAERKMTRPIAATRCNGPTRYNVTGFNSEQEFGPMSSLYVIDRELWFTHGIEDKWRAAINDPRYTFPFTVQGVLQVAIDADWHELPWQYQAHAGHNTLEENKREDIYTLHFMGGNPWEPLNPGVQVRFQEPARKIWNEYLCMSS